MNKVFFEDNAMRLMERGLDLAVQRQTLISGNLANIDTPGYKTLDLNFEEELRQALGSEPALAVTNPRHMSGNQNAAGGSRATPFEAEGLTRRNDHNNVNVDQQMAQLSVNALRFSMVAQLLGGKFRTLKNAISEGR